MNHQANLYQQMILDHNRKPKNFGKMPCYSHKSEGFNPLCGDHLWVYLKVNDEKIIEDITFEGSGCAISKASASLMTTTLKEKPLAEADKLFIEFQKLLKGNKDHNQETLGKLTIFSGIWQYSSRIKCAALAWHAMSSALKSKPSVSTE